MTVKELKKHLNGFNENDPIACILWTVEDIKSCESSMGLTDEDCEEIITAVDNNKDCNYGITWGVIEYYVEKKANEKYEQRITQYIEEAENVKT